jgi:hypothetical protein
VVASRRTSTGPPGERDAAVRTDGVDGDAVHRRGFTVDLDGQRQGGDAAAEDLRAAGDPDLQLGSHHATPLR